MHPPEFRLDGWIRDNASHVEYDLSSSGLREPDLGALGVDTSYASFLRAGEDHEGLLAGTIADIYGLGQNEVVITSGASEAILLAYLTFGRGRAAVPLPNYEPMFTIPRWLGIRVSSSLRRPPAPGTVYGVTDPNNPAGSLLDGSDMDYLSDASRKATVFINETYRGFTFGRPLSLFPENERFVTCSSMTKFYGLGRLRVGWMAANGANARELQRGRRWTTGHNSEFALWIAKQVLENRRAFVDRARRIYTENLELVRDFARSTSAARVTLPRAAPFCLVRYKGPDSVTFARRLLRTKGVLVSPGDYFGAPKAFRLCFTSDRAEVREGLKRLSEFMGP